MVALPPLYQSPSLPQPWQCSTRPCPVIPSQDSAFVIYEAREKCHLLCPTCGKQPLPSKISSCRSKTWFGGSETTVLLKNTDKTKKPTTSQQIHLSPYQLLLLEEEFNNGKNTEHEIWLASLLSLTVTEVCIFFCLYESIQ